MYEYTSGPPLSIDHIIDLINMAEEMSGYFRTKAAKFNPGQKTDPINTTSTYY